MDFKNNKFLLIIVILLNIILWPIFIVPNFTTIITSIFSNIKAGDNSYIIKRSTASKEGLDKVDFYAMRDPFTSSRQRAETPQPKKERKETPVYIPQVNVNPDSDRVQKTYTSRFKLKSLFKSKDQGYMATLEESSSYDSQSPDNVPYSYRFSGGGQPEVASTAGKNYMVWEGDTVVDEKVLKITESFVIMTKNNMYYKLTFSGGFSVTTPN